MGRKSDQTMRVYTENLGFGFALAFRSIESDSKCEISYSFCCALLCVDSDFAYLWLLIFNACPYPEQPRKEGCSKRDDIVEAYN
jgi:hypothetical protein